MVLVWLKQKRIMKNVTQQNVADAIGITTRYFQYIEQGKYKPSVDLAKRIAKELEFEWTEFFQEDQREKK